MFSGVLALSHNFQVLRAIVFFVVIFMMDDFPWPEFSSEHLLCHNSVFVTTVPFCVSFAFSGMSKMIAALFGR